jgi:hypothetical protein
VGQMSLRRATCWYAQGCQRLHRATTTKRQIRLKVTARTEQQAYIEFGGLLKEASEGRTAESAVTVAKLLDETGAALATVGAVLRDDAYLFANDPAHSRPWNPDWVTHQAVDCRVRG